MTRVIFDLETNNLLPKVNRIHCLAITDVDTEESFIFNDEYNWFLNIVHELFFSRFILVK